MNVVGLGGVSIAGPFSITDYDFDGELSYVDTTGRTLNNSPISAGERALILLNVSQSNAGNWMESNYTVTNTGDVFSLFPWGNGDCYRTADPVLGPTGVGGCIDGKIGDLCINSGPWDKFVCCNISVGASAVADWRATRTGANTGLLHHRLAAGIRRVRSFLQMQPATAVLDVGIFSLLGETDNTDGTSQAVWEAGFREMVATRDGLNVSWPWFVGLCTYNAGNTSSTIRAAQAAVVDNVTIFQGADTDDITDRQAGNTHFNNTGRDTAATRWKNIFTGHSW